jgi:hypothetical protein
MWHTLKRILTLGMYNPTKDRLAQTIMGINQKVDNFHAYLNDISDTMIQAQHDAIVELRKVIVEKDRDIEILVQELRSRSAFNERIIEMMLHGGPLHIQSTPVALIASKEPEEHSTEDINKMSVRERREYLMSKRKNGTSAHS